MSTIATINCILNLLILLLFLQVFFIFLCSTILEEINYNQNICKTCYFTYAPATKYIYRNGANVYVKKVFIFILRLI